MRSRAWLPSAALCVQAAEICGSNLLEIAVPGRPVCPKIPVSGDGDAFDWALGLAFAAILPHPVVRMLVCVRNFLEDALCIA